MLCLRQNIIGSAGGHSSRVEIATGRTSEVMVIFSVLLLVFGFAHALNPPPSAYSEQHGTHHTDITLPQLCYLPKDVGKCTDTVNAWYFNSRARSCEAFKYTGCRGNKNFFWKKHHCEVTCGHTLPDLCYIPLSTDRCQKEEKGWFYNINNYKCQRFLQSGCQANDNMFQTRFSCERRCGRFKESPQAWASFLKEQKYIKALQKRMNRQRAQTNRRGHGQHNRGGQHRAGQNRGRQNRGSQNRGGQNRGRQNRGSQNRGGQRRGRQLRGGQNRVGQHRGRHNRGRQHRGGKHHGQHNRGRQRRGRQNRGRQNHGRQNRGGQHRGRQNRGRQNHGSQNRGGQHRGRQNRGRQIRHHRTRSHRDKPKISKTTQMEKLKKQYRIGRWLGRMVDLQSPFLKERKTGRLVGDAGRVRMWRSWNKQWRRKQSLLLKRIVREMRYRAHDEEIVTLAELLRRIALDDAQRAAVTQGNGKALQAPERNDQRAANMVDVYDQQHQTVSGKKEDSHDQQHHTESRKKQDSHDQHHTESRKKQNSHDQQHHTESRKKHDRHDQQHHTESRKKQDNHDSGRKEDSHDQKHHTESGNKHNSDDKQNHTENVKEKNRLARLHVYKMLGALADGESPFLADSKARKLMATQADLELWKKWIKKWSDARPLLVRRVLREMKYQKNHPESVNLAGVLHRLDLDDSAREDLYKETTDDEKTDYKYDDDVAVEELHLQ